MHQKLGINNKLCKQLLYAEANQQTNSKHIFFY